MTERQQDQKAADDLRAENLKRTQSTPDEPIDPDWMGMKL